MAITPKQQQILEAILFLMSRGEIPTVREVGAIVGLRSSATVSKHLKALEKEGLITISGKSRGIRIADESLLEQVIEKHATGRDSGKATGRDSGKATGRDSGKASRKAAGRATAQTASPFTQLLSPLSSKAIGQLPVVGAIAAGRPIDARTESFLASAEEISDADANGNAYPALAIDPRMFSASGDLVAMKIEGDSMVEAGILDGDYVILRRQSQVENGEIAAVFIDGEGTLKRLYSDWNRGSRNSGGAAANEETSDRLQAVRLEAENDRFDPLVITEDNRKEVVVFGKYVGLVRGDLQIL